MERLRQLIAEKGHFFRQSFVGRELPAITLQTPEHEVRRGFTRALTDNFLEVRIGGAFPANQSLRVLIAAADEGELHGRVAASFDAA